MGDGRNVPIVGRNREREVIFDTPIVLPFAILPVRLYHDAQSWIPEVLVP